MLLFEGQAAPTLFHYNVQSQGCLKRPFLTVLLKNGEGGNLLDIFMYKECYMYTNHLAVLGVHVSYGAWSLPLKAGKKKHTIIMIHHCDATTQNRLQWCHKKHANDGHLLKQGTAGSQVQI